MTKETRLLRDTLTSLEAFLRDVPEPRVRAKSPPGEFSILENVCHLRDIEKLGHGVRIRRILNEDRPSLPDINGERLAIERKYNEDDLIRAFEDFRKAREENLRNLEDLSSESLDRSGTLEGVGSVTLGKLIQLMCEHDAVHLTEIRRLSRS